MWLELTKVTGEMDLDNEWTEKLENSWLVNENSIRLIELYKGEKNKLYEDSPGKERDLYNIEFDNGEWSGCVLIDVGTERLSDKHPELNSDRNRLHDLVKELNTVSMK